MWVYIYIYIYIYIYHRRRRPFLLPLLISTYKPQDGGEESDSSLRIKRGVGFGVFVRRRRVRHLVVSFKIDVAANAN